MRLLIVLLFLMCLFEVKADKGYFEYTPDAKTAYHYIMDLRFQDAALLLQKIRTESPDNLVIHHLDNYIDFIKVCINEDETEFRRLENRKDVRLYAIEQGDSNSPYYLYLQANIRLQWAVARLKFEEWVTAFREINQAYKLLEENSGKYPDFMPNKKDLGFLHAIVSSLPSSVEWVSSLKGNYRQGKRELQEVIRYAEKNDFLFEQETYILYAYVLLQFGKDGKGAWQIINNSSLNSKNSPTDAFILAHIAMNSGNNDQAIEILQNRVDRKNQYPFPALDFMLGRAKLHRLDGNADVYLKKYVNAFKGRNSIKEAYRLLAWHELVQDRPLGYKKYMAKILQVGNAYSSADESAQEEAEEGITPNENILKARLLFDGAYYQRAYNMLILQSNKTFENPKTALEYHYFLGRTTHQLKRYEDALRYYQAVIDKGSSETWYYACRAALESGRIYEIQKDYDKAKAAYQLCLSIKPSEHRYALHQDAKRELNRLK